MTSNSGLDVLKRKISEIIKPNILVTESTVRLGDLCELLAEKNIGGVPVVDDDQLVGIVTERDFALALAGSLSNETVGDIMVKDVITTTLGTPIESCSKIMVRNNLRRIPVVEEDKLVGIVTSTDIVRFFGDKEMFASMTSTSGLDVLKRQISDIVKPNISVTESYVKLGDLCDLLAEKNIGGVPVVDNDKLVGIITERDILNTVLDK